MVFNSLEFFFFAIAVGFGVLVLRGRPRIVFLVIASYAFYAAYRVELCLLLATSTVVDWFVGQKLYRSVGRRPRTLWLLTSLVVNLGLLGVFKYGTFALDNLSKLFSAVGINYTFPHWEFPLPPGISFYTFQTLSYTIDIYRRKLEPYASFWGFTMYVAFFPQLVAGPIVRAKQFLPQIQQAKPFQYDRTVIAVELVLLGLFKKMVLADGVAPAVNTIYNPSVNPTLPGWMSIVGTFLFAVQIYCDFSGYTDIARGVGHWLGYTIPQNFQWPYLSRSPQEFWRRWHQTLSFWIRDYLYISLGGSRRGSVRTIVNLFITMGLAGLWHGANWRFVSWGLFYGVWLALHRIYRLIVDSLGWSAGRPLTWIYRLVCLVVTFSLVNIAWVLFRATDFTTAGSIISRMLTWAPASVEAHNATSTWSEFLTNVSNWSGLEYTTMILLALCIPVHCFLSFRYRDGLLLEACPRIFRPVAVTAFILVLMLFAHQGDPFIYFAF